MSKPKPRIAVISLRKRLNFVYNSCLYEFEDIIEGIDDVDLIEINAVGDIQDAIYRVIRKLGRHSYFFTNSKPLLTEDIDLIHSYYLLFIIVDFPGSIININLINKWKETSKLTVCYLVELWREELDKYKNYLKFLSNFDFIFLGHSQIVKDVAEITQRPCAYLAPACDILKFRPESPGTKRDIDLYSMGRRSQVTHQALLKLSKVSDFDYRYDTPNMSSSYSGDHQLHRTFNANLLKSTRYFITNYAKIDSPELTQNQHEIGYRFFEGAASGAVLIGTPPANEVFSKYFDWENPLFVMDFDEPNIGELIEDLDRQPKLIKGIRNRNVGNSLLKHDWVYRWEQVLRTIGMSITRKTEIRKLELERIANEIFLKEIPGKKNTFC